MLHKRRNFFFFFFLILPTATRRSMQNHYILSVWVFVSRRITWWWRYDENNMTRRNEYGVCEITIDDWTGAYYYNIRLMYDRLYRWFRVVFHELPAGGTWTKIHNTRTRATGGHTELETARRLFSPLPPSSTPPTIITTAGGGVGDTLRGVFRFRRAQAPPTSLAEKNPPLSSTRRCAG